MYVTTDIEVNDYLHAVSQVKDLSGSALRYPLLTKLAKGVIFPRGNADTERLFSYLGLNKTKLRNSLSIHYAPINAMPQYPVRGAHGVYRGD